VIDNEKVRERERERERERSVAINAQTLKEKQNKTAGKGMIEIFFRLIKLDQKNKILSRSSFILLQHYYSRSR
jgi:hypothetical protein